jgi:homoserine kinase
VGVGYDTLGCALEEVAGDRVTVRRLDDPVVHVASMTGADADALPTTPEENTATAALLSLRKATGLSFGFEVAIKKGIPLSSGMGGSAASAVGAVVAANAVLPEPLPQEDLLRHALQGEAVASGSIHADNVAPCLYGGLILTRAVDPPDVISIPAPSQVRCVLVHPDLTIQTREARACVPEVLPTTDVTRQTAHLGAFIAGCYRDDVPLLGRALRDFLVEPHRAALIPGFNAVQSAAMDAGALGCTLAGAGPSVFAWCAEGDAPSVRDAMTDAFQSADTPTEAWISSIDAPGACLI